MPLADAKLCAAKPADRPYKLKDVQGLCLLVKPSGARLWRLRLYRSEDREINILFMYDCILKLAAGCL